MQFDLRDFQRQAATEVLGQLAKARRNHAESGDRSSFALSAITGSGKTVIATAVIEALVHGSPDLDTEAEPKASFLWVTDDPALNRQTLKKMQEASDRLQRAQLIELDNDFLNSELDPGRLYFLNIQKLSKNAGLGQGGNNLRQHSMWEVIGRTITGGRTDLVLVLDEAHKGMRRTADRKPIVRRIIDGQPGSNPPMPVVWGISATIARFDEAMKDLGGRRDRLANVEVDVERVRASGLVKDEIGLVDPDESGTYTTTLLREAVKDVLDFDRRWGAYHRDEGGRRVLPVLVVQVPDKATELKLTETVSVIESEWRDLPPDAVAHVFGEHEPLILGGRKVRWVPPESIEDDIDIRVVLAKTAISTGWDCPRAEVLYSERPAKDATHIAQIVGRMVRTPLTRRITTDDALNSVSCYLPLFDRTALTAIKSHLEGSDGPSDDAVGLDVVRAPVVFDRNPTLDAEVFAAVEQIVALPAPDPLAHPLRRAMALASLLTDTAGGGEPLVAGAGEQLRRALNARLDGLRAEHADLVAANVEALTTLDTHRTGIDPFGRDRTSSARRVTTHLSDLDRDSRKIVRSVREGVGTAYLEHRVAKEGEGADLLDIRVEVAALLRGDGVLAALDARATEWVRQHLATHRVAIRNTTGATRDAYRKVEEQTETPEPVTVELRANLKVATRNGKGAPLTTFAGHLYADSGGRFPADLNEWESHVIETEVSRDSFVAWYRNPSRPIPSAVRIAYVADSGGWTSVQPDFAIVSRRDDGSLGVSLVDPHGDYFADARAKLAALADYAERFGREFVRVESLAKADGVLRSLNLLDPSVRDAVRSFAGSQVTALYGSAVAVDYR